MKKLPVGIDDFKKVIENGYYYVDKTMLIHELLSDGAEVTLFTRPRRFGKTLNMSMLARFFDIQNSDENKKLFRGLEIENSEFFIHQGKYPVVYVSFKDIEAKTAEGWFTNLHKKILMLLNANEYLYEKLSRINKKIYNDLVENAKSIYLENALLYLTQFLSGYYEQKAILLLDEYDAPLISAWHEGYYDQINTTFRNLYSSVLKGNEFLQFSVLTGIMRVAKEGIFSKLSNLSIDTILDYQYSKYFGITEDELSSALKEFQIAESIQEVRKWYNGYCFGDTEVYNPWSVLNYLKHKRLKEYWINTSANIEINEILDVSDQSVTMDLGKLFSGETLKKYVFEDMTLYNLKDQRKLWTLLLYSGYLTIERNSLNGGFYNLRIPNLEIISFFERNFIEKFVGMDNSVVPALLSALKKKRITGEDSFEKYLSGIFLSKISYFDTAYRESFYQGFMICLSLLFQSDYVATSNIESGTGRLDLMLEPKDKKNPGVIFEFKISRTESELEQDAEKAVRQIENEKYRTFLAERNVKDIVAIGIAFYGKTLSVKYLN